jgi:GNAT superfamily N-acetyltransferase
LLSGLAMVGDDLKLGPGGTEQGGSAPAPRLYAFTECLRDGEKVTLRGVRPDDGPKVRQAFEGLGSEARYSRFFTYKADISDDELARFTGADFQRVVALLVFTGQGEDEVVIGGASYYAADSSARPLSAELAFLVIQKYQGHGMATMLLRHLERIARANGLECLNADVLSTNRPMLKVFQKSGLPMTLRHDGQVTHVTLALTGSQSP